MLCIAVYLEVYAALILLYCCIIGKPVSACDGWMDGLAGREAAEQDVAVGYKEKEKEGQDMLEGGRGGGG